MSMFFPTAGESDGQRGFADEDTWLGGAVGSFCVCGDIEKAVAEAVAAGVGTPDIYPQGGYTTQDVAQANVSRI